METVVFSCSEQDIACNGALLKRAGRILREGGTVIFPTETVYGLGANALDPSAADKIYLAKGRPSDNPLIVHISDMQMLDKVAKNIRPEAQRLMQRFWPGPLTLIFEKRPEIPHKITGGLETVGVRMPSDPIARFVIAEAGVPIAAPSANISGKPSITSAKHAILEMTGRVDMIIQSGDSTIGIESTVVDMTGELPIVLRSGQIGQSEILKAISSDEADYEAKCTRLRELLATLGAEHGAPKSPGMKYRHYSPEARLVILPSEEIGARLRQRMLDRSALSDEPSHSGEADNLFEDALQKELRLLSKERIRVLAIEGRAANYFGYGHSIGATASEIGKNLFATLRRMDEQKIELVLCEDLSRDFEGDEFASAIMERLEKAASKE